MAEVRPPQIFSVRMPDGTMRKWDAANEPKPDCVGNGSRNGFLYNCYTHPLGHFFQETIKNGIVAVIKRIHNKEIPRYDKQAYVYDDPRLQLLDKIITDAIEAQIQDTDKDRKRKILAACKDICLFMLKEDIFYRPRILQAIVDASKKIIENEDLLTSVTEYEAYNLARFGNLDGVVHEGDFSDLPMEERAKLPKNWTGLP
jgi:hypothetical protein